MIKILFVGTSIVGGGAERVFINIINSLSTDKYEIYVRLTCKSECTNLRKDFNTLFYDKPHMRQALCYLIKDINLICPDYVFTSHSSIAYTLPSIRFFAKRKFSIINRVAVCPSEYPNLGLKNTITRFIAKISYKYIDLHIAQTEFMKNDIAQFYNLKINRIKVIPNLVDTDLIYTKSLEYIPNEIEQNNYNVVAAGALYSIKGFDILIKAFKHVVSAVPNARLYILGKERYEIGYKDYLNSLIVENNLIQSVFLLGHKSNPYPYFKFADLFVLSSRKEGFPNVVLEALSLNIPVVATNCVDFSNIINDSQNGFVINKESQKDFSDAIIKASRYLKKPIINKIINFDYSKIFI